MNITDKLIWIAIFIVELEKYRLVYELCFEEKCKRYKILACGTGIFVLVLGLSHTSNTYMVSVLLQLYVMLLLIIVQQRGIPERIKRILLVCFFLICLDGFWGNLFSIIFGDKTDTLHTTRSFYEYGISLLCVLLMILIKKQLRQKYNKPFIQTAKLFTLPLLCILAMEILFTVTGLNIARDYVPLDWYKYLTKIISLSAYISIGILAMMMLYIRKANNIMEIQLQNEKMLMEVQQQYYEALLEKEINTRKYRHDMQNHLICMEDLLKNEEYDILNQYLADMKEEIIIIQRSNYDTGNRILSILTNHYLNSLEDVGVCLQGRISSYPEEMKLSILYGNILKNAVEELRKDGVEKRLEILFEQGKEFIRITVSNTISMEKMGNTLQEIINTDKAKKNHGFGISNAKKAAIEMGGSLELTLRNQIFSAVILLPKEQSEITV